MKNRRSMLYAMVAAMLALMFQCSYLQQREVQLRGDYELIDVLAERLDGGSAAEVRRVLVRRDEIVAVQAAGPRGDPARRMRTVAHPLAIGMGPYVARGLFHVPVGGDPMVMIRRRPPMVPLTHATLDLEVGGLAAPPPIGTLLINRDRVEWVMSAPIET